MLPFDCDEVEFVAQVGTGDVAFDQTPGTILAISDRSPVGRGIELGVDSRDMPGASADP
ncbi:hypothetical protein [Cumulibacter soli]|uniref:hypothetical protein n=1 Tax=Cumulibacter soli TaxID=2546344 RepID=UPI0014193606|nr:hypothetical protein [Cumulibacter soli]